MIGVLSILLPTLSPNQSTNHRLLIFVIGFVIWTSLSSTQAYGTNPIQQPSSAAVSSDNNCKKSVRSTTVSFMQKKQQQGMSECENDRMSRRTLRVLALHGSGGTALDFPARFDTLSRHLADQYHTDLAITAVEGPFDKDEGYSWWTMPPGIRSFTAEDYGGFETSASRVLDIWEKELDVGRFDIILGHSQGAILVASLLALERFPYHPRLGYIMNGVSFPNPYRSQIANLKLSRTSGNDNKGVDTDNNDNGAREQESPPPRVLFVMGTNDKITPNTTGEELRDGLQKAGMDVDTVYHPGGHSIPSDSISVEEICKWIQSSLKES